MVCEYIAFLSDRLSYASIKKYLGIIRIVHEELGLVDPLVLHMYDVKLVLLAVKKLLGSDVHRRIPISPQLLLKMHGRLRPGSVEDAIVWAICLLGFYGLLRVSNLLAPSKDGFVHGKHLARDDFSPDVRGFVVKVAWAKNNQTKARIVLVAIPRLPGHPLCPVGAISRAFLLTPMASLRGPAFVRIVKAGYTPVLYDWFRGRLQSMIAACGVDSQWYGTHSLRRGGTSWALHAGINSDVIKLLGDWHSDAYQAYLEVPLEDKMQNMVKFAEAIRKM
jgi:hypothetical protein